jgi:regulatory protein
MSTPSLENAKHEAIREKALELLSLREHSRKELLEKLLRRKFPKDLAETVVRELCEAGILDDARFAVNLVRSRLRNKPCGERGLMSLLRAKGIAPEDARTLVTEVMREEGASEEEMARRIAGTKLKGKVADEKALARVGNLLLRRGFDARIVRKILWECGRHDLPGEMEEGFEELRD